MHNYNGHKLSFQCRNEQFFARSRKSRNYAEAYKQYAAQVIPQIDPREIGSAFHGAGAEIAEKGHFWMETKIFPIVLHY
jgi:hypothetical protein